MLTFFIVFSSLFMYSLKGIREKPRKTIANLIVTLPASTN